MAQSRSLQLHLCHLVLVILLGIARAQKHLEAGDHAGGVLPDLGLLRIEAQQAALAGLDKGRAVNLLMRRGDWVQYFVIRPNSR